MKLYEVEFDIGAKAPKGATPNRFNRHVRAKDEQEARDLAVQRQGINDATGKPFKVLGVVELKDCSLVEIAQELRRRDEDNARSEFERRRERETLTVVGAEKRAV